MTKGAGPGYEGLQRKKLLTLLITLALVLTAALVEAGTGSIKFGLDEIFLALRAGAALRLTRCSSASASRGLWLRYSSARRWPCPAR